MADQVPFTANVTATFGQDGVWYIDAVLSFRDVEPAPGSEILGHGRLALLEGIAREALRGKGLGATQALVRMQIGDSYTELDANAVLARFPSAH